MNQFGYVLTVNGVQHHLRYASREEVAALLRLARATSATVTVRLARSALPEFA